jgi:nucleoside-diphosphate-sugar epimerase
VEFLKIFLTGGSGFVGQRLIPRLVADGHGVVALARSPESMELVQRAGARAYRGDMTAPLSLQAGLGGADIVVNLAAHLQMWGDYSAFRAVNVDGVRNLLEAMRASEVRRLVHVSAAAVVMDRPVAMLGVDERAPLRFPKFAPYIRSKAEAEVLIREQGDSLSVAVLRPPFYLGAWFARRATDRWPNSRRSIRLDRRRALSLCDLSRGQPQQRHRRQSFPRRGRLLRR